MSEVNQKKIMIFDTNFLIQHANVLTQTIEKLSRNYTVYITEISIEERVSQKYLELKRAYDNIEKFWSNNSRYIGRFELKTSFYEQNEVEKKKLYQSYLNQFGSHIIPFNDEMLKTVMERVFKKIPPFMDVEKSSDKGFKDTLIWLSILDFFKNNRVIESKVLFITNDKGGFRNYSQNLKEEFFSTTGIDIDIKDNSFCDQILDDEDENGGKTEVACLVEEEKILAPSTILMLRKEISDVMTKLCYFEGDFGEGPTFISHKLVEGDFIESAFMNDMEEIIKDHILEIEIEPSVMWGNSSFIEDVHNIPIENIEEAIKLHRRVKADYREYMIPFYNAVCKIFNSNYRSPDDSSLF